VTTKGGPVLSAANTTNGWTIDTYAAHMAALREADERLAAEKERFSEERDRRYSEVNIEREKALKIKEEADKAALGLAREIQSYKDEKANQLREQIGAERGTYATKDDLAAAVREMTVAIAPLAAFVSSQRGEQVGSTSSVNRMLAIIGGLAGISTVVSVGIGIIVLARGTGHAP
jgi:hypothetical protein